MPDRLQHLFYKRVVRAVVGGHNRQRSSESQNLDAADFLRRQQRFPVVRVDSQLVVVGEAGILFMPFENGGIVQPGNSIGDRLIAAGGGSERRVQLDHAQGNILKCDGRNFHDGGQAGWLRGQHVQHPFAHDGQPAGRFQLNVAPAGERGRQCVHADVQFRAVDVTRRTIRENGGGHSRAHRERYLRAGNEIDALQCEVDILASRDDLVGNHTENLHGQRVAEACAGNNGERIGRRDARFSAQHHDDPARAERGVRRNGHLDLQFIGIRDGG